MDEVQHGGDTPQSDDSRNDAEQQGETSAQGSAGANLTAQANKGGILVTGGTGFVGAALVPHLMSCGYQVSVFSRNVAQAQKQLPPGVRCVSRLRELSAEEVSAGVINLAGANLAAKRWTAAYKSQILASRVQLTHNLIRWFSELPQPPACLISGSAVGFYGDKADEVLTEESTPSLGFGHALCRDWEQAAQVAEEQGVRVCVARLGVIMDAQGGAFEQMVLPYRFKLGVTLGAGKNWFSWVHRHDVVQALTFLLQQSSCKGIYNLCAPEPVQVGDLSKHMRQQWPVWFHCSAPAALLKLGLGEFAPEVLLASQRALPERLKTAGFEFSVPTVEALMQRLKQAEAA
jgi:uncharacterized protein (TIGR01777 family)